jgi:hypothetical protein
METKRQPPMKAFETFVDFFNLITGYSVSQKSAMASDSFIEVYRAALNGIAEEMLKNPQQKKYHTSNLKVSTKMNSYSMVELSSTRLEVLNYIKNNPDKTARQIAAGLKKSDIRTGVVGRISELKASGYVIVAGEAICAVTGRSVETYRTYQKN